MNVKRATPEELLARRKDLRARLIPEIKFEIYPITKELSEVYGRLGPHACSRLLHPACEIEVLRREIALHLMGGIYEDHGCTLYDIREAEEAESR